MSKSLGNTVSPDEMVARYGADATRMYTLFAAPPDRDLDWQDAGVEGIHRFLARVHRFVARHAQANGAAVTSAEGLSPESRRLQRKLHQTIQRVSDDFAGRWHFNTCIAAIMELLNELHALESEIEAGRVPGGLLAEAQRSLVLLLHPFAPFLAHELWEMLGQTTSLLREPWPEYNPALTRAEEIELPVQINGKLRSRILAPADADDAIVRERALADAKVQAFIAGRQIVKLIVVPGKLINLVIR